MTLRSATRASAERVRAGTISAPGIAIVAPSLDILGGQSVQARSLEEALEREGLRVIFIPVNPRFPRWLRWMRRVPVLRTLVNQAFYFAELARIRQADVVHVFSASYWSFLLAPVPAIIAARLFSRPVILNYHSGEAEDHLSGWGIRVHPWLRRVNTIVVPSEYLKSVFADFGYDAHVVRNIIDVPAFPYRERRPLRPVLLSNRNLEAHYRVDVTLSAFAILKRRWPGARLIVAGDGRQRGRLEDQVRESGLRDVEFRGRVEPEDMPALYDEADIFVNASVVDNQPISILEAFAAGLPVVSTPTGDIPAMVQDGVTGCLVPPDDPEALSVAIGRLLTCPSLASGMARRAHAEVQKFTWSEVCEAWVKRYRSELESPETA